MQDERENESKFMSILERMGMVRKIDSEDDENSGYPMSHENITSQASNPTIPPEHDFTKEEELFDDVFAATKPLKTEKQISDDFTVRRNTKNSETVQQNAASLPKTEQVIGHDSDFKQDPVTKQDAFIETDPNIVTGSIPAQQNSAPPVQDVTNQIRESAPSTHEHEKTLSADQPRQSQGSTQTMDAASLRREREYKFDNSFWDSQRENAPVSIDEYTDRYLDIEQLYEVLSMKTSGTDTIYLVEEYLKSLPAALPDESRRDIVMKIVAASGFSFDGLMDDGVDRVTKLRNYAEQFARRTENFVSARNAELHALEQQILKVRSTIDWRRELHKKQFFSIEAEEQRLRDILAFLSE